MHTDTERKQMFESICRSLSSAGLPWRRAPDDATLSQYGREQARAKMMQRLASAARGQGYDVNTAWLRAGLQMRQLETGAYGDDDRSFDDNVQRGGGGRDPAFPTTAGGKDVRIQPFRTVKAKFRDDTHGEVGRDIPSVEWHKNPPNLEMQYFQQLLLAYQRITYRLRGDWSMNDALAFAHRMWPDVVRAARSRGSAQELSSQIAQDGRDAFQGRGAGHLPWGASLVRKGNPSGPSVELAMLVERNCDHANCVDTFRDQPVIPRMVPQSWAGNRW